LWREEFSIFTADERYVSRRQMTMFSKKSMVYPAVTIARAGEVPVGGVKLFQYADDQCILVRIGETSYAAYSQKCTHLSCAVYYAKEHNRLECPCHEGYFSVQDGSVLQGPPTRPLPKVILEQRGSDLMAVGMTTGSEG
jgi:Rieske Fe-S protein